MPLVARVRAVIVVIIDPIPIYVCVTEVSIPITVLIKLIAVTHEGAVVSFI